MLKLEKNVLGLGLAMLLCGGAVQAATIPINEGFEGPGLPAGWVHINNSSPLPPARLDGSWHKPDSPPPAFPAFAGSANSYFADNFGAALVDGNPNNISDWLFTPNLTLANGTKLTFWTRGEGLFPDRLQVRMNTNFGTNVGNTATSVGDFTTLLFDTDVAFPGGYPTAWTMVSITLSGLAGLTDGRFAFRYFITDNNANGDYIGIDSVTVTAVPEPETTLMLALGLVAMGWGLRSRARR